MERADISEMLESITPLTLPLLAARPLVSVLMANYNYARFIGAAIESLQAQSWDHWELILCDDGSTDNSLEIASSYAAVDKRITIISQPNSGQPAAFNAAFLRSRGEVLSLLDSDDLFVPAKIESVVRAFHSMPNAGMVIHTLQRADEHALPTGTNFPRSLVSGWLAPWLLTHGGTPPEGFPSTSALAFRRQIAALVFPAPKHIYPDAFLAGTSALLTEVAAIDEDLSVYRIHGRNLQANKWPNTQSCLRLIRCHSEGLIEQAAFAKRHYGDTAASLLKLDNCSQYLATLLKYKLLTGSWPIDDDRHSVDDIMRALNAPRLWKLLFSLPRPFAVLLLHLWEGQYPLKRFLSVRFRYFTTAS